MSQSLKNRSCLITGATSGIGKSATIQLSLMGADICFIARNEEKAENLVRDIFNLTGKEASHIIADLSSQKEINNASEEFLSLNRPLHILLNNAGVVNSERRITVDGFEEVFAINHLSYFSLTLKLLNKIKESSPSRIVNVSSAAHRLEGRINLDDLNSESSFKTFKVYGQSKLANILFTRKLASLLRKENITVNCLHPGWVSTSLGQQNTERTILAKLMALFSPLLAKNSDKGAETSVYLCSSKEVSEITGEYFVNCKISNISEGAMNADDADGLWEKSLNLTGLKYPGI